MNTIAFQNVWFSCLSLCDANVFVSGSFNSCSSLQTQKTDTHGDILHSFKRVLNTFISIVFLTCRTQTFVVIICRRSFFGKKRVKM